MARSTHFIQTSMCCCWYYSMKFLLDGRGTLLNLSLKCIPWLAWDRFKKVDSKCNEWGYLDPKFGLICNYCHYSRVNIWNAMIVMMIMMAVRASEWTRAVVTSSQHQEKYEISWKILLFKKQKLLSLKPSSLYIFTQICCFVQYFRLEDGENMDIWWKSDKMSQEERRDPVGLLGSSQQAPPQFQILHMI